MTKQPDDRILNRDNDEPSEANRTHILNAHLREIQRKKADAYNVGAYTDEHSIMSKTDKGRMTTSQHPKTKEISHVWHDEYDHRVEPSGTGHRANSQMRKSYDGDKKVYLNGHEINVSKQKRAANATARRLSK
jgi:hypothetical protein